MTGQITWSHAPVQHPPKLSLINKRLKPQVLLDGTKTIGNDDTHVVAAQPVLGHSVDAGYEQLDDVTVVADVYVRNHFGAFELDLKTEES